MNRMPRILVIALFLLSLGIGFIFVPVGHAQSKSLYWKRFDVNITVLADVGIVSIGSLGEDGNPTGAEFVTRLDSVSDRSSSVVAPFCLSIAGRFCPFPELCFPISRHYYFNPVIEFITANN